MCYAYYDDFERRTKKDSARKPEARTSEPVKETEVSTPSNPSPQPPPRTEGTLWTFLARRRREVKVTEPKIDRISEKV